MIYALLFIISAAGLIFLAAFSFAEIKMYKRPIRQIYLERLRQSDFCPVSRLNERFVRMLLAFEDDNFFEHRGILPKSMLKAVEYNIKHGKILMGSSTITQQLIKNLYFRFDSPILRKLPEIIMTLKAEKLLSKKEILELYINIIYFGHGRYGITDAAEYYFSEKPEELTVNQMFLLCGIICNPVGRNPVSFPEFYAEKQRELLNRQIKKNALKKEEIKIIEENLSGTLDPKLRKTADEDAVYGKDAEINERFGANTDFGHRFKG